MRFYAKNTNKTIYAITDYVTPDWTSATQKTGYDTSSSYHTYTRAYYPYTGPANEEVKVTRIYFSYYDPKITPYSTNLHSLVNQYIGLPIGENVCHGEGAPCFETTSDSTSTALTSVSIKLYSSDNTTLTSGTVKLMLSSKKFKDGDYQASSDKLFEKEYAVPSSGNLIIPTTDIMDIEKKGTIVWMNLYETSGNGKLVQLESFGLG